MVYVRGMHRSRGWVRSGRTALTLVATIWLTGLGGAGCGAGGHPARPQAERDRDSAAAVASLQAAKFDEAATLAAQVLAHDPDNSRAAAVRALATYQAAGSRLRDDLVSAGA